MRYNIIEKRVRGEKEEAVLAVIKIAGLLTLAAVAPNAAQYLLKKNKKLNKFDKYYVSKVARRLIDRGLLSLDGMGQVSLTDRGQKRFDELEMRDIVRPKKWDGKYRVVIFDIEEKRKKDRDLVRNNLISLGFARLQNSVWVCPFECEEFITLMKTNSRLSGSIIYMTVESIENDQWLKQRFNLVEVE